MYIIDSKGNLLQKRKTVFESAYLSLSSFQKKTEIPFLLENMNDDGWFQFFGKNTEYLEDLDDTALAWLALIKARAAHPDNCFRIVDEINAYHVSSEKLFTTWRQKPKDKNNPVDIVVNLNVLRLLHTLGKRNRNVEEAIIEWFRGEKWLNGTNYYHNPIFIKNLLVQSLPDFIPSSFTRFLYKTIVPRIRYNWISHLNVFQDESKLQNGLFYSAFRCRTKPIFFKLNYT